MPVIHENLFYSWAPMVDIVLQGKILLCSFCFLLEGWVLVFKMHFSEGFLDKILRVPSVEEACFEVFNCLFEYCFGRVSAGKS